MNNNKSSYGVPEAIEATPEQRAAAQVNKLVERGFSAESLQEFVEGSEAFATQFEGELEAKDALRLLADIALHAKSPGDQKEAFVELRNSAKEYLRREKTIKRRPLPSPEVVQNAPREWLIERWLQANTVAIFSGQGGAGKSRMMLQIVGKIACGWPGNAWEPKQCRPDAEGIDFSDRSKKVLIVSWEDDDIEMGRRLLAAQESLGFMPYEKVRKNVDYIDMRGEGPIWGVPDSTHLATRAQILPAGIEVLEEAKDYGADLLVLDPSAAAFGGNENDRASVREYMSYLDAWAYKNKCGILMLSHPPKNDADYSGSTDWLGSARVMWRLTPKKDETNKKDKGEQDERLYSFRVVKANQIVQPYPSVIVKLDSRGAWIRQEANNGNRANEADRI